MIFSKFSVLKSIKSYRIISFRNLANKKGDDKVPTVVTIIGGHTGEGQLTALLLKQSKLIDEIRLYSGLISPCGIAMDLSHIDTNPIVKAYTGQVLLKDAVTDAQVVLICGGQTKRPCKKQMELFEENADYVKNIATYMGEFNPKGILCISTPPISALVPMVSEELKKEPVYDPRKILGIMTLGVIRSNSLVAKYINKDPNEVSVPVIGGMCRGTLVPIFSQIKPKIPIEKALASHLYDKIVAAEDEAVDLKYIENSGSCFASSAFACARFVTSVLKGLRGQEKVVECAFVRQLGRIEYFLPYMGSIVKLGPEGVESTHMPKINDFECELLLKAHKYLKIHIAKGMSYICGDLPREYRIEPKLSGYCQFVNKEPITQVGDFKLDLENITKGKREKCVEIIT